MAGSYAFDIKCVITGPEDKQSCLLRCVRVIDKTVLFDACGAQHRGLHAIQTTEFSVKVPPWENSMFTLAANQTCDAAPRDDDRAVHVILDPFYLPNAGHAMADDIYLTFRLLLLFGLHTRSQIVVLSVQPVSSFPPRVKEMYDVLRITVRDIENTWYPTMVTGIAGLGYHLQKIPLAYGYTLDVFCDWVYQRAGIEVSEPGNPHDGGLRSCACQRDCSADRSGFASRK